MAWFVLALGALASFSIVLLLVKKILDNGLRSEIVYMYMAGIAVLIIFTYLLITEKSISIPSRNILLILLIIGTFSALGNILMFKSMAIAPNPGYTLTITMMNSLVVSIAAIFLFKSDFTLIKGLGVVLATVGVILLSLK